MFSSLDQGGADEDWRLRFKTDTYCNRKSIPFLKFPIRFSQFFFVSLFSQKKRRIETRKQMKALLVFAIVLASACLCLAAAPADGQVAVPGRGWVDPECVHQVPDGATITRQENGDFLVSHIEGAFKSYVCPTHFFSLSFSFRTNSTHSCVFFSFLFFSFLCSMLKHFM